MAAALSAVSGSRLLASDCPKSFLQLSSASGGLEYPLAVIDTTLDLAPLGTSRIAYDLVEGTVGLSLTPVAGEGVVVITADQYDVVGLPAGTLTEIDFVLEIEGSIGTPGCGGTDCGAQFVARVFDQFFYATTTIVAPANAGSTTRHEVLSLPLRLIAGTPVTVRVIFSMTIAPGGNHGGEWAGRFHFVGVPVGARIVSCHGYVAEPTPARQATWGRIKTLYR